MDESLLSIPPPNFCTSEAENRLINQIQSDLRSHLRSSKKKDERTITYKDVAPETAQTIIKWLGQKTTTLPSGLYYNSVPRTLRFTLWPNLIRTAHQDWLHRAMSRMKETNFLTPEEHMNLVLYSGMTGFNSFSGPYKSSYRVPDQAIVPAIGTLPLPSLVLESGWGESREELYALRDLWLVGGSGSVKIVMLVNWTVDEETRKVSGDIEVFGGDSLGGDVQRVQKEVIFPAPSPEVAEKQSIRVARKQLFGSSLPMNEDPDKITFIELKYLRLIAEEIIRKEGYVPA
ncbi:hypothetical protein TERG_05754 [Paecilomyces variotii No. 5]|uniref:Uncharacterized protein n=1 Tax=Byssochlamys spectabilis (strain No. 5 / NBRC 109023) TaxID=1356009 RepID=V5FCZ7_BYSSN|nr:hypothetical protein TERG_05754 [Paecilomyces variotii No. 5]